jgi:hypothetical protein
MWVAAAVLVATACSSDAAVPAAPDEQNENPGDGIWAGTVQAEVANRRVVLKNQTERPVGYLVLEKNMAIVAMFPPCTSNCTTLAQGGETSIRYEDIPGYSAVAREAIVYWWMYGPDGRAEGGMSSVVVRL